MSVNAKGFAFSVGLFFAAIFAFLPTTSCDVKSPDSSTYYTRTILPILNASCARTNTGAGCHVADDKGNALGNLTVETYADIAKRRDLLVNYGPYGRPAMLAKNIPPFQVTVKSFDDSSTTVVTDI